MTLFGSTRHYKLYYVNCMIIGTIFLRLSRLSNSLLQVDLVMQARSDAHSLVLNSAGSSQFVYHLCLDRSVVEFLQNTIYILHEFQQDFWQMVMVGKWYVLGPVSDMCVEEDV